MSVVKINAIEVPEGAGPELEKRFANRLHAVDGQPGFLSFELLRPVKGEDRYFVVTHWDTEESFQAWLSTSSSQVDLPPGRTVTVTVALAAPKDAALGEYDARLAVTTDTPYPISPVPVALTVRR